MQAQGSSVTQDQPHEHDCAERRCASPYHPAGVAGLQKRSPGLYIYRLEALQEYARHTLASPTGAATGMLLLAAATEAASTHHVKLPTADDLGVAWGPAGPLPVIQGENRPECQDA